MAGRISYLTVVVSGREYENFDKAVLEVGNKLEKGFEQSGIKVNTEMLKTLQRVAIEMMGRHGNPWQPGGSGKNLYSRTGGGLRSIRESIKVQGTTLSDVVGQISAPFPMSVHETGATITPKRSKYLTIPLPPALDSRGVPLRKKARDWDNTFVAQSRKGNLLIFRKDGRGITPLYVLKTSVTIPARLGMGTYIQNDILPYFERRAFEAISRYVDRYLETGK